MYQSIRSVCQSLLAARLHETTEKPTLPTKHTTPGDLVLHQQRNIYVKGLVAEVAEFLFGDGFAITGGDAWRARRRAVGPSLHRFVHVCVCVCVQGGGRGAGSVGM